MMGNNWSSSLYFYVCWFAFGLFVSVSQVIGAGVPSMVKDLSTDPASSKIGGLIRAGDRVFFVADDSVNGRELWKTDGTPEGTSLVKDIRPGYDWAWGEYEPLVAKELNGVLFFMVNDGTHGHELWKSDGSAAGTVLVKDINPSRGSGPSDLFVFDNQLFFSASDETHGRELWKTNGTEAGTVLVKDINSSGDSNPTEFFDYNGTLLFSADGGYDKRQLWKTDGTEAGTDWIKIINQTGHSNPKDMALFDGKVFFSASNGPDGTELWTTDGTSENTKMFLDIHSSGSSYPANLVAIDSLLYFSAMDSTTNSEPWISNGEPTWGAGTRRFAGLGRTGSNPGGFLKFKDEVFFTAKGDLGTPYSDPGTLWKTDGTFENTLSIAADIPTGAEILIRDEMLVILANKIWTSDGTKEGTVAVSDAYPDVQVGVDFEWAELNGVYITVGFDEDHGKELWAYDLAGDGPVLLRDIHSGTTGISYFGANTGDNPFVAIDGVGFFAADSDPDGKNDFGNELWKSDGTAAGTSMVKDINPGDKSSSPQNFFNVDGVLFFTADDGTHGYELWKSDGTEAGTVMVKNITETNPFDTKFENFSVIDNTLYFSAGNWSMYSMLWKSDGTDEGTVLIKEFYAGARNMYIGEMISFGGALLFASQDDNDVGKELWKSDGTPAGTVLLKDINESGSSTPSRFTVVGDSLYFIAKLGNNDVDLWKTNGTPEGTVMVRDFSPSEGSGPRELVSFQESLFFTARDGVPGVGLWTSDGTETGTELVHDLNTAYQSWDLTAGDDFMLLMSKVSSLVSTTRLWRSDGTNSGTRPVEITLPDGAEVEYGSALQFTVALGSIYFSMDNAIYGNEVWSSDGTDGGTQLLIDLYPGPTDSNPKLLGVIGERGTAAEALLFGGDDYFHGNELWKVGGVLPILFEEWQVTQFSADQLYDFELSGPTGDPDGDGITNLREYIHAINPNKANSSPVEISVTLNEQNQINAVSVTFPWSKTAINVDYELQVSTDLTNWTTLESEVVQTVRQPLSDLITLQTEPTGLGSIDTFIRMHVFEL